MPNSPAWLLTLATTSFCRTNRTAAMQAQPRFYQSNGNARGERGRARGRGRGRGRGRRGGGRGGYRGNNAPFTPVAKGYRYFKHSFLEDPWAKLDPNEQPTSIPISVSYSQSAPVQNAIHDPAQNPGADPASKLTDAPESGEGADNTIEQDTVLKPQAEPVRASEQMTESDSKPKEELASETGAGDEDACRQTCANDPNAAP